MALRRESWTNLRVLIATFPIERRQRLHDLRDTRGWRQQADALVDLGAQRRRAQCRLAVELDMCEPLDRHENPDQRDAVRVGRGGFGANPDVLKAAESDEVIDGLAHAPHRQRVADACLDERHERGIGKGLPAHVDANARHRPSQEVAHIGARRGDRQKQCGDPANHPART